MRRDKQTEEMWQQVVHQHTPSSHDKKAQIIDATVKLIAREGIEAVTFESIGQLLKTTKANIRYHFQDKDDLIFRVARVVVANAQMMTAQLVERQPEPAGKVQAVIDGAYRWYELYPDHVRVWALFIYYVHLRDSYREFFQKTRAAGRDRLQMLLRALPQVKDSGRTKEISIDYPRVAENLQNILYGQIISLAGTSKDILRSQRDAEIMMESYLRSQGLRWQSQSSRS